LHYLVLIFSFLINQFILFSSQEDFSSLFSIKDSFNFILNESLNIDFSKKDGWKIIVIFQPHLFSRTKLLLNDFAKSFADADSVILLPIYYAREVDDATISSEILKNEINSSSIARI
jgi:hypothetical protein